jgi:hypothetical protein
MMKETNTTRAFTRFISVSVVVLMTTTLGLAVVPDSIRRQDHCGGVRSHRRSSDER